MEVSIDAQKDKSNEPISQEPSASAGTGQCPMETEEESVIEIDPCVQSQLESLEPTSQLEMPVDMALSLLSAENDSNSLDSKWEHLCILPRKLFSHDEKDQHTVTDPANWTAFCLIYKLFQLCIVLDVHVAAGL